MKHLLDFEKPYIDLQRKLEDLREHPDGENLNVDIGDEIRQLEEKIESKKKELYSNLTAWQRVQLARHPQRPYSLDYINHTFSGFSELHGDRLFHDDHAMVAGFAMLGENRVMVVGTQKGRDTKENIKRNFGCAHPEGYRKALRIMGMANRFGLPIIALIDTAGAYPGVAAEERHIAKAIAINLREGDELVRVIQVRESDDIVLVSSRGQTIRFSGTQVRPMGRSAGGVRGMRLREDDVVVAAVAISENDRRQLLTVTEGGYGKRTPIDAYPRKGRGTMGVKGIKLTEARGAAVVGARMVDLDDEVILVSSGGVLIRISVSEIAEQRRDATGVKVMNIGDEETVAALSPVTIDDELEEALVSDVVS